MFYTNIFQRLTLKPLSETIAVSIVDKITDIWNEIRSVRVNIFWANVWSQIKQM